jgi:hypothetical protein
LTWLAGARRAVYPNTRIGFHAAYRSYDKQESNVANALVGSYLTKLGFSADAIVYMTKAAQASMEWLTKEKAQQYGIEFDYLNANGEFAQMVDKKSESKPGNLCGLFGFFVAGPPGECAGRLQSPQDPQQTRHGRGRAESQRNASSREEIKSFWIGSRRAWSARLICRRRWQRARDDAVSFGADGCFNCVSRSSIGSLRRHYSRLSILAAGSDKDGLGRVSRAPSEYDGAQLYER